MRRLRLDSAGVPAFLLAFIFCGAIVGETLSLSLVVSSLGPTFISKLYIVNGLLLLGLPLLFFNRIDKIERGKLLSIQLLFTTGLLSVILILLLISIRINPEWARLLLIFLYPVSYLSKTTLFLTFWTLANDIYTTSESKRAFPVIAAWGFAGGLAGACIARLMVVIVPAESVLLLWALSYVAAWQFTIKVRKRFRQKLLPKEDIPEIAGTGILENAGSVLTLKLVRLFAVLHFFIFLGVFSIDYLFWNKSHEWFTTSESIASFQLTFYFVHALATVGGLWFVLPRLISKVGFTRILYTLPIAISSGAIILLLYYMIDPGKSFFAVFVVVQFFRYVSFENAFSPIYQMFFAAVEKDKRGRAKTLLEGFVKPGSIIISGLVLTVLGNNTNMILLLIAVCGVVLIFTAFFIRRTYSLSLIPETPLSVEPLRVITELGAGDDQQLMPIIMEYALSEDVDMRILSVKILCVIGSGQSLECLINVYRREKTTEIKEMIARSLEGYYGYQTRPFIEQLLRESNQRIRANAIYSLNRMHCNWKRHLTPLIRQSLFESSIRVQIEAACFLWGSKDRYDQTNVMIFLNSLLDSASPNRRSAGLYLIGLMKTPGWEEMLVENLDSTSEQVFTKCIEVILRSASLDIRLRALQKIDNMSRTHIAVTGKTIETIGAGLWDTLVRYLPKAVNRRMVYELVWCLRIIMDSIRSSGRSWLLEPQTTETIHQWIFRELENIYRDGFVFYHCFRNGCEHGSAKILEEALRENITRFCEWAVNAMILMDKRGITWRHNDIDIREQAQRLDLIEIIESTSYHKIGSLVLPLLKAVSWENISRTGKNYFHFKDEIAGQGLLYFITSDNRWLCLCALYTVAQSEIQIDCGLKEALNMLVDDQNPQVSLASRDLLEKQNRIDRKRSQAFQYLERVLFFKKTSLFRGVSAEKLIRLAEITQEASYERDKVISVQGEVSDHLYIVKSGKLRVEKSNGSLKTVLALINSGEAYGETGLFTQSPRSASAVADEACELYIIKRGSFKKLLLEFPDIAYSLLEVLSERLRRSGEEMVEMKRKASESEITIYPDESFT